MFVSIKNVCEQPEGFGANCSLGTKCLNIYLFNTHKL